MLRNLRGWKLQFESYEEERYMLPMFSFVLKLFSEIFGEKVMNSEHCILFNDSNADCPMLIINTTPVMIRTCLKDSGYWCQYIYQLSHEITHYVIRQYKVDLKKDEKSFYTYGGVIYPVSNFNNPQILQFTPSLIDKVIHRGYSDEQEEAYIYLMKNELTIENGQISAGLILGEDEHE